MTHLVRRGRMIKTVLSHTKFLRTDMDLTTFTRPTTPQISSKWRPSLTLQAMRSLTITHSTYTMPSLRLLQDTRILYLEPQTFLGPKTSEVQVIKVMQVGPSQHLLLVFHLLSFLLPSFPESCMRRKLDFSNCKELAVPT